MLRTRLTEMFALERPIVLAPLANGATSGHLAAAVSAAGGLGLFGGIHAAGAEWVREQIRFLRTRAHRRWGVGFITCRIAYSEANFQTCLDEHAPVIASPSGIRPNTWREQRRRGPRCCARFRRSSQRVWLSRLARTCWWPKAMRRAVTRGNSALFPSSRKF